MEEQRSSLPKPKASTLPRPSKLPQPRSITSRGPSTLSSQSTVRSISFNVNEEGNKDTSHFEQPHWKPSSIASHNDKPIQESSSLRDTSTGKVKNPLTGLRPPLRDQIVPQASHRPEFQVAKDAKPGIHENFPSQPLQQENQRENLEFIDDTGRVSPYLPPASHLETESSKITVVKRAKPSLSDRAMESLSQVPPSPAKSRRRSSFFNPQSPMCPKKLPPNSTNTPSVPKINYDGIRSPTTSRPPSQPKSNHDRQRLTLSGVDSVRPKGHNPNPVPSRRISLRKENLGASASNGRSPKVCGAGAASKSEGRIDSVQSQRQNDDKAKNASSASARKVDSPGSSSSALRQQIAKAKARHRAAVKKATSECPKASTGYDFENCDDPFGQGPKHSGNDLKVRIDDARRDGKLNIAALELRTIPLIVLQMYEPSSMEDSSTPWDETIDLIRLNAADNELDTIDEHVFPDVPNEALLERTDGNIKENQFGGLEHLDLHNNRLERLPLGLRRLERLSTINLSRNKLDNSILEIVTRLPLLRHINLAHNKLNDALPDSVRYLTSLESFDLSRNQLTMLPQSLEELVSLRSFDISGNRLNDLPFESLAKMSRLSNFSAASNRLSGSLLPAHVVSLPSLEFLDVSSNGLTSLTEAGKLDLPSINRLDVANNRLSRFPDISAWTNLVSLVAEGNSLEELPTGMTELHDRLKFVNLERNHLKALGPEEGILAMNALESLLLSGNPFRDRRLMEMGTVKLKEEMERRVELRKKFGNS